jgi:hypothetical protein
MAVVRHLACFTLLFLTLWAIAAPKTPPPPPPTVDVKTLFDQRYAAWQLWSNGQPETVSLTTGKEYSELMKLGVPALPMLCASLETNATARQAPALADMVLRLTKRELPKTVAADGAARVKWVQSWWKEGRQATKTQFDALAVRWKEEKAKGGFVFESQTVALTYDDATKIVSTKREQSKSDLGRIYHDIQGLGIEVLPFIMEQLLALDYDLLPAFGEITQFKPAGDLPLRVKATRDWWEKNKSRYLIPAG